MAIILTHSAQWPFKYGLEYLRCRIQFPMGAEIYLVTIIASLAIMPNHPLAHWIPRSLSTWVKWPGHEADRFLPSSTKVMKEWS